MESKKLTKHFNLDFVVFREGSAISIDSELNYGKSFDSETFGNPPLHLRKGNFQCSEVEIYNFK